MGPSRPVVAGSPLSLYENDTAQHVAMIDTSTASALGISPARLPSHPAVFVNGIAYTVVGVYSSAQRVASGGSAMLIPENTVQQALNAGVREYKAAFAKALKTMPALLRTTSATPNLPGPPPGHRGRHSRTAKPSPSHS